MQETQNIKFTGNINQWFEMNRKEAADKIKKNNEDNQTK